NSTAGSAAITNNGTLTFTGNSTAGNAAIINNNTIQKVDFSGSAGANGDHKISAGSIAGGGGYRLGINELTVGSDNQSTTVSGIIEGTIGGGPGGSLVKVGTGTLTLARVALYTDGTTINGGVVSVDHDDHLGGPNSGLTFGGGTLRFGASFNLAS